MTGCGPTAAFGRWRRNAALRRNAQFIHRLLCANIGNRGSRPRAVVSQPARKRTFSGLLDALRERGYVEGRNIVIEYRSAEGTAYLRSLPGRRTTLGIDMRHERRRGLFCQTQSTVRWIFV
jgi:hypothetical protein